MTVMAGSFHITGFTWSDVSMALLRCCLVCLFWFGLVTRLWFSFTFHIGQIWLSWGESESEISPFFHLISSSCTIQVKVMPGESESDAKAVIIHNNRLCLMPTLACGEVDARDRPHIKEFIDSKLCDGVASFL